MPVTLIKYSYYNSIFIDVRHFNFVFYITNNSKFDWLINSLSYNFEQYYLAPDNLVVGMVVAKYVDYY